MLHSEAQMSFGGYSSRKGNEPLPSCLPDVPAILKTGVRIFSTFAMPKLIARIEFGWDLLGYSKEI